MATPSRPSARTRSAAKTKPPTRMGMAISGRTGAAAISLASSSTRAAIALSENKISGAAGGALSPGRLLTYPSLEARTQLTSFAIGREAHFQMARGGGRAGQPRQERNRLLGLQDARGRGEVP